MSQPPAAWLQDPEDPRQLRWWDGVRWTGATAPSPSAAVTTQFAPASVPAATPQKRRTGWRTAGIIVGALVVGGVLARLSPIAILLVATAVVGLALYVMISRPLPALGLRSRMSGVTALGLAALLVTGGGIASASSGTTPTTPEAQTVASVPTATSTPKPAPTPTPIPTTFETAAEEVVVPFEATTIDDPQRDQGTTALVTAGVNGVKVITYRVTLVDGVEVSREVVGEAQSVAPVTEVTAIGSKAPAPAAAPVPAPAPVPLVQQGGGDCNGNYSGACVPNASDVDCAGGSGDGPAYVHGPVTIVGTDVYQLDRDGDGIACD